MRSDTAEISDAWLKWSGWWRSQLGSIFGRQEHHQMTLGWLPGAEISNAEHREYRRSAAAKPIKLIGLLDQSAVLHEGLKTLIESESVKRHAKTGGKHACVDGPVFSKAQLHEILPEL
jgi:hypothetical protein